MYFKIVEGFHLRFLLSAFSQGMKIFQFSEFLNPHVSTRFKLQFDIR